MAHLCHSDDRRNLASPETFLTLEDQFLFARLPVLSPVEGPVCAFAPVRHEAAPADNLNADRLTHRVFQR